MLTDRIIGALTFRREVYSEVEHDESFTSTAWMIVAVVTVLSQMGANVGSGGFFGWLVGTIIGTLFAIGAFAAAAYVIAWVGRSMFNAEVTFEEMVRTLGLAYIWTIVGVLGILGVVPVLSCLLFPVRLLAAILGLIAWFVAAKEALDLEWVQTIVVVVIGWVIMMIITMIAGLIVGLLGFGARTAGDLLGG